MQLRLLGPVELRAEDDVVAIGPAKRRAVLAALAVDAGRPVLLETLVDRVWDETAPARARAVLYAHVSRLRDVLGEDGQLRITRKPGGYLLEAQPDAVDLHRFTELTERSRDPRRDPAERIGLLREALDLWHGPPLADIRTGWAARLRERLERQRIDTAVEWAEAELRRGRPEAVLSELQALAAEHPMAEHLTATLMLALHAVGRDAQALSWYAVTARHLADELGVDPGSSLQQAHERVLRADVGAASPSAKPAQLPLEIDGFVGREEQLAQLDALLPDPGEPTAPVVIAAVSGMAGVGKTSFALHWAHRAADRFDGQLYVDLRGFDDSGRTVEPADAMRGFLDALGAGGDRGQEDVEQLAAMFRTALAGRRMLLVLDNARDSNQVRPMLPGAPGCMVVVTSRDQLSGLVVNEGAHPLQLPALPTDEARRLLESRIGAARVAAEPAAARDIIARCAQLPLALAIVAGRAAIHPHFALAAIAAELGSGSDDLDGLRGEDVGTDLRLVFSWSYDRLGEDAARLFRLLGLHPGEEFSVPAAASLAGLGRGPARRVLAELTGSSLVAEPAPGRYAIHDLLHAYAAELVASAESAQARAAALDRLLDHYLRSAHAASQSVNPHRDPIPLPAAPPGTTPEAPGGYADALEWFTANWRTLRALVELAVDTGRDLLTGPLAWAASTYFERQGLWQEQAAVHTLALVSAERLADVRRQLDARRSLAAAHTLLGNSEQADHNFFAALDLAGAAGDGVLLGHVQYGIAWMYTTQERSAEALEYAHLALAQFRKERHASGEARCLNAIGWQLAQLGQAEQAIEYGEQALRLHLASGDRYSTAETWDTLGVAQNILGRTDDAINSYRQALQLCVELGDRFREAETLVHLGDAFAAAGEIVSCRDAWQRAAEILERLGHPQAAHVSDKLRRLES